MFYWNYFTHRIKSLVVLEVDCSPLDTYYALKAVSAGEMRPNKSYIVISRLISLYSIDFPSIDEFPISMFSMHSVGYNTRIIRLAITSELYFFDN